LVWSDKIVRDSKQPGGDMATYQVGLSRIYVVDIEARNEWEAARLAEFFLGFHDSSNESEREEYDFEIKKIDMVENEAFKFEGRMKGKW